MGARSRNGPTTGAVVVALVLVLVATSCSSGGSDSSSPLVSKLGRVVTVEGGLSDGGRASGRLWRALTGMMGDGSDPVVPLGGPSELADRADRIAKVRSDVATLVTLLNAFWTDELAETDGLALDEPDAYVEYHGERGNPPCGAFDAPKPNNASYCRVDETERVAWDVEWLQRLLVDAPRDATTYVVLAHEWGHVVHDTWVEQQPGVDDWTPGYLVELSADCLAGVFLGTGVRQGFVIEDVGDRAVIGAALRNGGSDPGQPPGDHGTSMQRLSAFQRGYFGDARGCRVVYRRGGGPW